jgi:hypothetical protein
MPSQEPYLNLTLYDSVSDKTETFLNFRNTIAGTSDSNFIKIGNGYNTLNTKINDVEITANAALPSSDFTGANVLTKMSADNSVVPIENGGIGANTVAAARNNLGLGNTSGALPIANGGTGAADSLTACNNLGITQMFANPNLLINGDFQVWQRGTNFSITTEKYTADRWAIVSTSGSYPVTASKNDGGGIKLVQSSEACYLRYTMEDEDYTQIDGKTVTLSYEKNGTKITSAFTASSAIHIVNIGIPAENGTEHIIKNIKLELGSVATPFVPKPYGEELALCQRYYLQYNVHEFPMSYLVIGNTANVVILVINTPVPMRTVPTIGGNYQFDIRGGGSSALLDYTDFTGITRIGSNTFELYFTYTGTSGIFTNNTSNFAVINKGGTLTIDGEI